VAIQLDPAIHRTERRRKIGTTQADRLLTSAHPPTLTVKPEVTDFQLCANCCREQMQQGACTETEFIRVVGAGGLASVCPVTVVADISCEDCAIERVPL
jgi:hypothetical protein